jgi:hypothetical protein
MVNYHDYGTLLEVGWREWNGGIKEEKQEEERRIRRQIIDPIANDIKSKEIPIERRVIPIPPCP